MEKREVRGLREVCPAATPNLRAARREGGSLSFFGSVAPDSARARTELAVTLGEERHAELIRLLQEALPIVTAMERGS
jgi:hypothetical protein